MTCEEIVQLLNAELDGALDPDDQPRIDSHLTECAQCRNAREHLLALQCVLVRSFRSERGQVLNVADEICRKLPVLAGGSGEGSLAGVSQEVGEPLPVRTEPAPTRWHNSKVLGYLVAGTAGFLIAALVPVAEEPPTPDPAIFSPSLLQQLEGARQNGLQQQRSSQQPFGWQTPVAAVARIVHATGPIAIRTGREPEWRQIPHASLPNFLCPQDSIVRTESGAVCELQTASGSEIRMNEATVLAIRSGQEVDLMQGEIWCDNDHADQLQIRALDRPLKEGETSVNAEELCVFTCGHNGQCVTAAPARGPLRVAAASGPVEMHVEGISKELPTGMIATITDRTVTIEEADDVLLSQRWMQPLLTLHGYSDPELHQRVNALLASLGRAKSAYFLEQDIRSLGEFGALPLLKFIQSPGSAELSEQRQTAMRILKDTAPVWMIPDLISLLEDDQLEVRTQAAEGLVRLTGLTQGMTRDDWANSANCESGTEAWQQWWNDHKLQCSPCPVEVRQQ